MNTSTPSVETILAQAVEIAGPAERQAFVEQACGGDAELRRRVEQLIANHFQAGSFLERPAVAMDPDGTAAWQTAGSADGPGTVIGPYKLLEQIGEGGMGVVYVAEQTRPMRRRVALKIIKPGMDTKQVVARFEAQRQALAMMDHPNIAKVHDGGATESGRPYFVMELVRGIPITEYCDREQLSITDRLELFVLVCRAVQHAHQKGIIHRDLKPSNILVTVIDGVAVPKIIDFGVAKATGASLTERTLYTGFHQFVGTPLYISPEQADLAGIDIDTRSDIYSLGVLLYELLTGTTPFDQETFRTAAFDEMRRIIREDEPPKPSTRLSSLGETLSTVSSRRKSDPKRLGHEVRGELDWIVMKALEKDRQRRYETANDFAADVMRHLTDKPVEACPPSAGYRFGKFARKHRAALATVGAFAALLVVGSVVSTLLMVRALSAERLANQRLKDLTLANAATTQALAETRQAQAEARTEADKAKAVNDFLTNDLLTQAEPANSAAEDHVTLLEVLDRAAAKVGERFAGRPGVEDALRRTIARTYHGLASWEKAERQWRSVLEAARRRSGFQDAEALTAQHELAHILIHRGRVDAGVLDMLRAASEGLARLLGPDHPETLGIRNHLAWAYSKAGRTAESNEMHAANLKVEESKLGSDHPITLVTRGNLASAYLDAGRTAEAIKMYEAILKLRESKLGPDHPNTLTSRNNLGNAYLNAGRTAEAIKLLEATLKLQESKLGPDHPDTLYSRNNLAGAYQAAGRAAEAIALLEANLKLGESKLGPDHPNILATRSNLANAYLEADRTAEAIKLNEANLKFHEPKLGPDHPDTLNTRNNLAYAYHAGGRTAEAIKLFEATLKLKESKLGPDHPDTLATRGNLANAYLDAGRTAEAIKMHEANLKLEESKLGPEHPDTLITRSNLASAYRDAGRTAEAITMHEATLKLRESKLGPDHPHTLTSRNSLARAYHTAGRLTDALPLFQDTLPRCKTKLGPDHPKTLLVMNDLTAAYLDSQRWSEAENTARDCLGLRAKKQPADWWNFHTMSQLGAALAGQKKYAEAEPLLLQGYDGLKAREAKIPAPRKDSLASAAACIVKLYEASGTKDKAAEWRKKLEAAKAP